MPVDFGAHQSLSSSGLVHASNTMRAGPLKVRVMTSSRSDFRSTFVRFRDSLPVASIDLLLAFQFLDNLVQLVEACVPELAVPLDPGRLFLQPAEAKLAGPHAPYLLRGDEPRLLQDADMLLHAGERHVKLIGEVRDRSVRTAELLQNAASRGVRERGERDVEGGLGILNHVVQYGARIDDMQGGRARAASPAAFSRIDLIPKQVRSARRPEALGHAIFQDGSLYAIPKVFASIAGHHAGFGRARHRATRLTVTEVRYLILTDALRRGGSKRRADASG